MKQEKKYGDCFPELTDIKDDLYDSVKQSLFIKKYLPNQVVMDSGNSCSHFAFLTSGSVDVFMRTKSGREVKLYTLTESDFCVLNTMCLICDSDFPGKAITNAASEFIMVESKIFKNLMHESDIFRHFIFEGLQQQLAMLLTRFEDAYAPPINEKLAALLITRSAHGTKPIYITQNKLADEVGTVREIISRHMCFFRDNGWLHYTRGIIHVDKPEILSELANVE